MKQLLLLVLAAFALQLSAKDVDKEDANALESVIKHNINAMNDENVDEYMKDIHPDSPAFANTKLTMTQIFQTYDLQATHLSMKPLIIDDQYFIVRAKQKIIKISGNAPFQNNIVDVIHVYKKKDEKWLLWSSMILEIQKADK